MTRTAFLAILILIGGGMTICGQGQASNSTPAPAAPEAAAPAVASPPPPADAQSAESLLPDDPTVFIGKTIAEVIAERGPPSSMAAIRGPEEWQDDVEFSWGDGSRFDWYQDRVWRIDLGEGYKGSVFGLFIGDASDKALSLLGQPHFVAEDGLVWRLPWRGYPVQLRIAVRDAKIADIAVFRADL